MDSRLPALLSAALAACAGATSPPQDEPPTSCLIATSYTNCYDGWTLVKCSAPNQFVVGKSCADQGFCLDACGSTWTPCATARPCGTGGGGGTAGGCGCRERFQLCTVDGDCKNGDRCFHETGPSSPMRCYGTYTGPSACDRCLSLCQGYSGCCTGTGCMCDAEC